ncbi:hypothetical protein SORBI_3004G161800 [Sorghum bicolor]|uniref:Uncharacterized protein n=1 Tax=Sorghum bicolor TaxID=4558 RepID=A0A1Z5RMV8_SORBI|nr:hypothetical protein SORBI_3004G161800 [Sorghum bicolor]
MWTQTRAPGCADGLWDRGARELGWRRDSRAAPYPACPRAPLTDLSLAGYKTGAKAWIPQSEREEEEPIDGVQLRGHDGRGGQVPRPAQPQQQHHPDGRRGVAAPHAPQLLLRVLREPQPRRRGQVRVRAPDPRRLLQVPAPPHQLPGPRPRPRAPVPADLPRRRRARAGRPVLRLLPHRRGPVSDAAAARGAAVVTEAQGYLSCQKKGAY